MFNYFTSTKVGNIFFSIGKIEGEYGSKNKSKQSILGAIETLERSERILQGIEEWLGCGLDILPTTGFPSLSIKLKVEAVNKQEEEISCLNIITDRQTLSRIIETRRQVSKDLAISGVLPFTLMLGEIELKEMDCQRLNEKSTLLIPESFNKQWPIRVLSKDSPSIKYKASIDACKSSLKVNIESSQNSEKRSALDDNELRNCINAKVVSKNTVNLPLQLVLSPDSTTLDIECYINNLICEVSINDKSTVEGSLIPLADGYGVMLDSEKN